ncbi:MAG: hypothetical protein KF753_21575 [Caldilineaceae bacterium]|nr:hypothetical protein [Caldilineaceae bacterium]
MGRAPFFEWQLDRWKIGLALVLWLGLIFFLPARPVPLDPQGVSPIVRPGQRPVVGASNQAEVVPTNVLQNEVTSPLRDPTPAAERIAAQPTALFNLAVLEPGQKPLTNSTPLVYGETVGDGFVEIALEGRRYATVANSDGYWQFAPVAALPVGMTWVQARLVDQGGVAVSETAARMLLVGKDASPVAAPDILIPLPFNSPVADAMPNFSGVGPAHQKLVFYARITAEDRDRRLGAVTIADDGTWQWQVPSPFPPGKTTVWAVVVSSEDIPLSRSWPVVLEVEEGVAVDAQSSAGVAPPLADGRGIR